MAGALARKLKNLGMDCEEELQALLLLVKAKGRVKRGEDTTKSRQFARLFDHSAERPGMPLQVDRERSSPDIHLTAIPTIFAISIAMSRRNGTTRWQR